MKKLLCLLLVVFVLFGCNKKENEIKVIENVTQENEVNNVFYYGQLSDAQKAYYDLLLEASINMSNTIQGDFKFNADDFNVALYAFSYDYPVYYWWRNNVSTSYTSSSFTSSCKEKTDVIKENLNKLNEIKNMILDECVNENYYVTYKNIHDYIVNNVDYDDDTQNTHNIVGSLIEGKSVCDGYALAFKYLLNEAGFNCNIIDGDAIQNNILVQHAWNIVELNNKWYQSDITWDDPINSEEVETISYDYFMISDTMIGIDHFKNSTYNYPECNDESLFYFNMSGAYLEKFDEEEISEFIQAWINTGSNDIYIKFFNFDDGVTAYKWLLEEQGFVDIYKKSNKNYSISYGGEYTNNSHVLHLHYEES